MSSSPKTTLTEFGYGFKEGKLRQLDEDGNLTDKPFKFDVYSSHSENQKNYEALGEVLNEHVYNLLIENGLHKIYIPDNVPKDEATFVFSTKEELKDVDKLMIIIHGSGVVRAGQWARSLIINDSIDSGTVLPYVKKARDAGFEVLITNTNDNFRNGKKIQGNGSPESHAESVWKKFVQSSNANTIVIVAHSYGGIVTAQLAKTFKEDFDEKVIAVAFTDSVHSGRGLSKKLIEVGVNFVTSEEPLDTVLRRYDGDMERRSAGHIKHEMTSYSCIEALFKFINERYIASESLPKTKKQKTDEL